MMVLLHHIVRTGNEVVDGILELLGPLAVGGFYFLSGYGIAVSYRAKGKQYLKNLVCRRIPMMYLILVATNFIYLGVYYLTGNPPLIFGGALSSVLYISFVKGFVQLYSWIYFIPNLIVFYVVIAVVLWAVECIKSVHNKGQVATIIFIIVEVAIILLLSVASKQLPELRAYFCFPFGLICGAFMENICKFIRNRRAFLILLLVFLSWCFMTFLNVKEIREYLMPLLFCMLVVFVVAQKSFVGSFGALWFGKISLYVYLFHGAFFKIFNHFIALESLGLFLLVFSCSVVWSMFVYEVVQGMKIIMLRKRQKRRFF
ncbi:MAG: acyltransferase family protein [Clostridia bacterium]|nr:acyltransferase family protein [Clostridia bacterium]